MTTAAQLAMQADMQEAVQEAKALKDGYNLRQPGAKRAQWCVCFRRDVAGKRLDCSGSMTQWQRMHVCTILAADRSQMYLGDDFRECGDFECACLRNSVGPSMLRWCQPLGVEFSADLPAPSPYTIFRYLHQVITVLKCMCDPTLHARAGPIVWHTLQNLRGANNQLRRFPSLPAQDHMQLGNLTVRI